MEQGISCHRISQRFATPVGDDGRNNQPESDDDPESQANDGPGLEETGKTGMIERAGQVLGQITPGSDSILAHLNHVLLRRALF